MKYDFSGIEEKLKRADENIGNLNREIGTFLKSRPDSGIPEDEKKAAEALLHFQAKRDIPPRFPVLTGEIAHHLRSCLDHLVWLFSEEAYRIKHERRIGFPIYVNAPNKDEQAAYDRQIKGITCARARCLIKWYQPYNTGKFADDPLAIVHNLDRVDKHQNLVLVRTRFRMDFSIPAELFPALIASAQEMSQDRFVEVFENKAKVDFSPQIAFAEFGQRENEPVISGLNLLRDRVVEVVSEFEKLS